MPNPPLQERIENVEQQLKQLVEDYKNTKTELVKKTEEYEKLKKELEAQNEKAKDFQDRTKISKIADYVVAEGTDSKELVAKIDEYIKEIDNCIAYIDRQL